MTRTRCTLCNDWLPASLKATDYPSELINRAAQRVRPVFGDKVLGHYPNTRKHHQEQLRQVHDDCLHVFTRSRQISEVEALSELSELSLWKQPWTDSPLLQLDHDQREILPVDHFAAALRLPQLSQLCPELTKMIQEFSADSLVWRFTRVLMLAQRGLPRPGKLESFPLCRVSTWERGEEPVVMPKGCKQTLPQVIRLTVDSCGLQQIERLQEIPVHGPGRSEFKAFALFHEEEVQGAIVFCKSGLARLASGKRKTETVIRFWDTPTPIPMQFPPRTERFLTAELGKATGVTFFVHPTCGIVGVQAHSDGFFPCAAPSSPLDELSWVYIPTPPGDRITACKAFSNFPFVQHDFLYRKQLSGMAGFTSGYNIDCVHFRYTPQNEDIMPTALVSQYSRATQYRNTWCYIRAYREPAVDELDPVAPLKAINLTRVYNDLDRDYSTLARLRDLASIQIFYLPKRFQPAFQEECWITNQVHGMVLTFNNGAQTALGQCRFDICRTRTFHKPIQISMLRACACPVVASNAQSTSVGDRHCHRQRCLSEAVIQPSSLEENACSAGHNVHHGDGGFAKPKWINYPATDQYVIHCLMRNPRRIFWAIDIERPGDFET